MKQQAIEKILDYLTSIPAWYLATVEDDQPHVRPFSFAAAQDERIWFCTATTKDVYQELERNPKFELTAWKPGSGWIILRGRADLDEAPPAWTAARGSPRRRGPRRARRRPPPGAPSPPPPRGTRPAARRPWVVHLSSRSILFSGSRLSR